MDFEPASSLSLVVGRRRIELAGIFAAQGFEEAKQRMLFQDVELRCALMAVE